MKKPLLLATLLLSCLNANAVEWKIIPQKSKIEFKALQNSAAITGSFEKFSAKIDFDAQQLKNSKVEIEIDMASLKTSLSDASTALPSAEWFAIKTFPKANFKAEKFDKISDKKFIANGNLTIKGKTLPCKLEFTFDEYSQTNARAHGNVVLKRSDFAIGAAKPENAHGVKDEVIVNFVIEALR